MLCNHMNLSNTMQIEKRNELRQAWAAKLATTDATITCKSQAAKQLALDMKVLNSSDAVCTTAKDLAEQQQGNNLTLDAFDKRMSK
jgi:hypothetical protein